MFKFGKVIMLNYQIDEGERVFLSNKQMSLIKNEKYYSKWHYVFKRCVT